MSNDFSHLAASAPVGTADAEIKMPSKDNLELAKVLSLKPEVGPSLDLHAWAAAKNAAFLISAFLVHSTSFPQSSSEACDTEQSVKAFLVIY